MSDDNDMLHVAAIGRFEPGDVDPDGFHVLLSGSKRAVGLAGQFLGEAVVISTADLHAATLARAERAEALLKEAVEALRPFASSHYVVTTGDALTSVHWRTARATLARIQGDSHDG